MQSNKSRDTGPELALRRELHRRGLRYRVGLAPLAGVRRTVDVAFPRLKIAVLVDGCFWHGCDQHHRLPKSHSDYWQAKLERNMARDRSTTQLLEQSGWRVIRLWEHEKIQDMADLVQRAVLEAAPKRATGPASRQPPARSADPSPQPSHRSARTSSDR
jgi:DNA mismatch endonuclease (patch repair protein)